MMYSYEIEVESSLVKVEEVPNWVWVGGRKSVREGTRKVEKREEASVTIVAATAAAAVRAVPGVLKGMVLDSPVSSFEVSSLRRSGVCHVA